MNDSTIITLCFSGAAVSAGIAILYWRAMREASRLTKMVEDEQKRTEFLYEQIRRNVNANFRQTGKSDVVTSYLNTLGRGAAISETRAAECRDSAAPHAIKPQPRRCVPTVRLCPPEKINVTLE